MKLNPKHNNDGIAFDAAFTIAFALILIGSIVSICQGAWWHTFTAAVSGLMTVCLSLDLYDTWKKDNEI